MKVRKEWIDLDENTHEPIITEALSELIAFDK